MKTGTQLIAEERERQMSKEGWTPLHDSQHNRCEMVDAANTYAQAAVFQVVNHVPLKELQDTPEPWPWDYQWWKPSEDPVRNLVKAGALIAAEIDRLQAKAALEAALE